MRCCDRSDWQVASIPVGRCRTRTADSVTLRCCPPAPVPLTVSHWRSAGRRASSPSDGAGRTATVTVLVWTRPRRSVGGTRCHRWPPASCAKAASAPGPVISTTQSPGRASTTSISKTPPLAPLHVEAQLIDHEQFRVVATFCSANFHDHSFTPSARLPRPPTHGPLSAATARRNAARSDRPAGGQRAVEFRIAVASSGPAGRPSASARVATPPHSAAAAEPRHGSHPGGLSGRPRAPW